MEGIVGTRPSRAYWVVAALAVIWMLFGVMAWTMDLMTDEATLESLSPAQRELYAIRPSWLFVVYGIAIFAGLGGAAALLLRRAWAVPLFALSLAAVLLQFGYTFVAMGAIERLGAAQALPFPVFILLVGVALLLFALRARRRGWLRAGH